MWLIKLSALNRLHAHVHVHVHRTTDGTTPSFFMCDSAVQLSLSGLLLDSNVDVSAIVRRGAEESVEQGRQQTCRTGVALVAIDRLQYISAVRTLLPRHVTSTHALAVSITRAFAVSRLYEHQ